MATARSGELRDLADGVAAALPALVEEVVLTGSVSRGVADDLSDVEMLVVAPDLPGRDECEAYSRAVGLEEVDLWSKPESADSHLVSGRLGGVAVELVWWSRARAEERVGAIAAGTIHDDRILTADALVHGLPLRTSGLLVRWQELLHPYPPGLATALIEDAAEIWGGYQPSAYLSVTRSGERLVLTERLVDTARRIVRIVFALNETWEPTLKRLGARTESLAVKPSRLAERIEAMLLEPDPRRAVRGFAELAGDAVALAPDGPYVRRARVWLAELASLVR